MLVMKLPFVVAACNGLHSVSAIDDICINKMKRACLSEKKTSSVFLPSSIALSEIDCKEEGKSFLEYGDAKIKCSSNTGVNGEISEGNYFEKGVVSSNEDEDYLVEVRRHCSRASSIYDDSGFNSSVSEDRDDLEESLLNLDFDCDEALEINNYDDEESSERTDVAVVENGCFDHDCEQTNRMTVKSGDSTSNVNSINVVNSYNLDLSWRDVDLATVKGSNSGIAVTNSLRSRRSDMTNTANFPNRSLRSRTTRRWQHIDYNNNESGGRNLQSVLGKAPFKLVDCFQDKGLLSLAACIVYTLFLFLLCTIFGMFLELLKTCVGQDNLRQMRDQIVRSKRAHRAVNAG